MSYLRHSILCYLAASKYLVLVAILLLSPANSLYAEDLISHKTKQFELLLKPGGLDYSLEIIASGKNSKLALAKIEIIEAPSRLVLDLTGISAERPGSISMTKPGIRSLRYALHPDHLRIVLDAADNNTFELLNSPSISPQSIRIIFRIKRPPKLSPTKSAVQRSALDPEASTTYPLSDYLSLLPSTRSLLVCLIVAALWLLRPLRTKSLERLPTVCAKKRTERLSQKIVREQIEPAKLRDYYTVLELDEGASQSEIRQRFRKLAKELHTDRLASVSDSNKTLSLAGERFLQVKEAYEQLRSIDR